MFKGCLKETIMAILIVMPIMFFYFALLEKDCTNSKINNRIYNILSIVIGVCISITYLVLRYLNLNYELQILSFIHIIFFILYNKEYYNYKDNKLLKCDKDYVVEIIIKKNKRLSVNKKEKQSDTNKKPSVLDKTIVLFTLMETFLLIIVLTCCVLNANSNLNFNIVSLNNTIILGAFIEGFTLRYILQDNVLNKYIKNNKYPPLIISILYLIIYIIFNGSISVILLILIIISNLIASYIYNKRNYFESCIFLIMFNTLIVLLTLCI